MRDNYVILYVRFTTHNVSMSLKKYINIISGSHVQTTILYTSYVSYTFNIVVIQSSNCMNERLFHDWACQPSQGVIGVIEMSNKLFRLYEIVFL